MSWKVTSLVCFLLFKLVLPIALLAASIVRYNAVSFLYGVCLLAIPLLKRPDSTTMKGATGLFLKLLVVLSSLAVLTTITFHIVLVATATDTDPYGSMFSNCSASERIARQVLVERLDAVPAMEVARLVVPDGVVLVVSILVLAICTTLIRVDERARSNTSFLEVPHRHKASTFLTYVVDFFGNLLLGLSGIVVPSLLNGVYFLVFLIVATLWACSRHLGRRFAYVRIALMVYSGLHLAALHLYQFQFFQTLVPEDELIARMLGLTAVVKTDCDRPWMMLLQPSVIWPYFVNPGMLLSLYWVLAVRTRIWMSSPTTAADTEGVVGTSRDKRRKKKRRSDERQVAAPSKEAEVGWNHETGSILFSGSTYGEDDNLEQCLVEDGDKATYSSTEPVGAEAQPGTSREDVRKAAATIQGVESEEEEVQDSRRERRHLKRTPMVSIFVYLMKQSYVMSLIAMMAWSIAFHSWLTFVLLLGACTLWMLPKSRHACLVTSPVLVMYGEVLIIAQYVYGMNLPELPEKSGDILLKEVGLQKFSYPCLQLGAQILFLFTFWLTLRQFMRERRTWGSSQQSFAMESVSPHKQGLAGILNIPLDTSDMIDGYDSNTMKTIGRCIWHLLCKYWIFVCVGMQLLISLQDVVIYRIIYMILLLLFILCFQLSYTLWRVTMLVFWWVVIIYSMAVLIMIYTYQFSQFPRLWQNSTGLAPEVLTDIGLEQYDTAGLFLKLLTPTSFLIIVIIQVHYFHRAFLRLSALDRHARHEDLVDSPPDNFTTDEAGFTTATDSEGRVIKESRRLKKRLAAFLRRTWHSLSKKWAEVSLVLWRLAEIHMYKVVFFVIMIVCAFEVSAIDAVYVILLCIFLPLSRFHVVLSHIAQFWTGIVLLTKAVYQLRLIKTDYWITYCSSHIDIVMMPLTNSTNETDVIDTTPDPFSGANSTRADNAKWAGLIKINDVPMTIAQYLRNYLFILLVIALERIIYYHQTQHFNHPLYPRPASGIVFPAVKRERADQGLIECAKFFFNYFFYKFGLEICYVMMAITISIRLDAFAVLYAIILGILLLLNRRQSAFIWPVLTITLTIILPLCYLSSLGFPIGLCLIYPWKHTTQMDRNLEQWLFLPDYANPPHASKLLADFFQLLFVCLQWRVFMIEKGPSRDEYGGGSNDSILPDVEACTPIPVEDFTTKRGSYLDVVKYFVFVYMFWVTLAIVFIAGTARINLFSMGYVIAVFCFMWYGQEFLLKPLRRLLRMWNFLIGYNFFVLFAKACLQLVGCVYIRDLYLNNCWLIQLLGVSCLAEPNGLPQGLDVGDAKCDVQRDDTGLIWDVVCFVFLLLQRRIYSCQYFRHVVDEQEAQSRLASRGAELINRIIIREVNKQKEMEKEILLNIKKKMKYLKEKQARLKKDFKEPDEHYIAIRSGDYYLFEDDTEEEEAADQASSLHLGKDKDTDKTMGPLQMITTAMDSGTKAALQKQKSMVDLSQGGSPTSPVPSPTPSPAQSQSPSQGPSLGHSLASSHAHFQEGAAEEPKPGTSRQEDEPPLEDEEIDEKAIRTTRKWVGFFVALLGSVADWIIGVCNRISCNYRMVARKLNEEMKVMKRKIQDDKRMNLEMEDVKTDSPASTSDMQLADQGGDTAAADADLVEITVSRPGPLTVPKLNIHPSDGEQSVSTIGLHDFEEEQSQQDEFEKSQSGRPYRLVEAIYYLLVSRSELLCYFLMILNQMIYSSLLSLPLPLMVFLWGMLSVPRPSKTFWITVITYTEAVVVTKYLFQFGFFPWNTAEIHESPFWPPKIMGIEQRHNYAAADLALLLALFIHRSILKRYGLWKDTEAISADVAKAGMKELSPGVSPDRDDRDADSIVMAQDSAAISVISERTIGGPDKDKDEQKPPSRFVTGLKKLSQPFRDFFAEVTGFTYNATVDVYAPMFACDFITFFIVVFGYWAFGPATTSGGGDVTSYIRENRVPVPFLVMLIVQFMLIIIDRALFLRKNVLGKFIFQILLVILIHVWLFFILPYVTNRSFSENKPAQLWYFVKCIYFALSAYQIRCGYPTRILGNFLTKNYNYLNLFLFKGFLAIPFLLELRALMDWIWTDSTLSLGSWLQMEDIYANVFILKCWRRSEVMYPTPRAQRRKLGVKYGVGGLLLFLIIFIIWFPLVLFSIANTVFVANTPYEAVATVTIGGYQPIFKVFAQEGSIRAITESEYSVLRKRYSNDEAAVGFFGLYQAQDVSVITLNGKSTSLWGISPPSRESLIKDLNGTGPLSLEFAMNFHREPDGLQSDIVSYQIPHRLKNSTRQSFARLIESGNSNDTVDMDLLFPRFLHLAGKGFAKPVDRLMQFDNGIGLSNVTFKLYSNKSVSSLSNILEWWGLQERIMGSVFSYDPTATPKAVDDLTIFTFNDRKAPTSFSFITGYGIMGLYVSLVLVIGRFFRVTFFTGMSFRVMFDEMPFVDRILQLCLDIYMVRETGDLRMEEELFAKLIFLYRSPETIIKWTKHPKED